MDGRVEEEDRCKYSSSSGRVFDMMLDRIGAAWRSFGLALRHMKRAISSPPADGGGKSSTFVQLG